MALRLWLACVALLMSAPASWALSVGKETYGGTLAWDTGSATLPELHQKQLERILCLSQNINLEVMIAVGHASAKERLPQELSERRATAVKNELVAMGVDPKRIYVEGKGFSQPVSRDPVENQRVEWELVGTRMVGGKPQNCSPQWQRDMLDLPLAQALTIARAQIREGWIRVHEPLLLAIDKRRMDLLDALLLPVNGFHLSANDRRLVFHRAAALAYVDGLRRLIDFGIQPGETGSLGETLVLALCNWSPSPPTNAEELLETARLLIGWGARPLTATRDGHADAPLTCAARNGLLQVVNVLLAAGAKPNAAGAEPAVVEGGPHRAVVARLLEAGADPKASGSSAKTLFHSYRMQSAGDVRWLMSLGLDVNQLYGKNVTPLWIAIEYAGPEVLDAMKAAGARFVDVPGGSHYQKSRANPAGRAWLIDQGMAIDDVPKRVIEEIALGDARIAVLEAFLRRGISLSHWTSTGRSTLAVAIENLSPAVVELLLREGADIREATRRGESALVLARRRSLQETPSCYVYCDVDWLKKETRKVNAPDLVADRAVRRARIIQMLEAKEAMP